MQGAVITFPGNPSVLQVNLDNQITCSFALVESVVYFCSSLNATDFLERLRGKKLVFSGDSLNRNMYMSMICIFWSVISDKSRIVRPSMYSDYKTRGDMSLIFKASFV